jgi:uncharacterized damage-inducible protein DinB
MTIAEALLPEFEREMAGTRRVLERVPDAHGKWKPHPKSSSMGDLALHLARLPRWAVLTLELSEYDLNPPGGTPQPAGFESAAAMLATFDANVANARDAIRKTSDAEFKRPWSLKNAGKTVFTMPREACLHGTVLKHMIHHRGQLTVYLRLRDIPVPAIYGPTADESPF